MLKELWEQNQEINNGRTTILMTRGSEFEVASMRIAVDAFGPYTVSHRYQVAVGDAIKRELFL
jgi:hypothetical protein